MARVYGNPPVIEAVCEFRFDPGQPWDWTIPGLVYEHIRNDFPKKRQVHMLEVKLQPAQAGTAAPEQNPVIKMQFLNSAETSIVQIGPDLLAINALRPYPKWQAFQGLIVTQLETYREIAKPKGLQRAGLRYINRIEIPGTQMDLAEYFQILPRIPEAIPQEFHSLTTQIEIPFNGTHSSLRLAFGSIPSEDPERMAFLLDLDFSAPTDAAVLDDPLSWIELAHTEVERTFDACFTEKTHKEIFGEVDN